MSISIKGFLFFVSMVFGVNVFAGPNTTIGKDGFVPPSGWKKYESKQGWEIWFPPYATARPAFG